VSSETPDLGELLAEVVAFTKGTMHTCIPAQIITYNFALQTATVKPTVSGRFQNPDTKSLLPFPLPPIANVPVWFPKGQGGLSSYTWPLVPGDNVILVIADRSIDEWKSTGAPESVPADVRRFDLSDAIAFPGCSSINAPIPASGVSPTASVLQGTDIRLGSSAAASPVVLQTLLSAFLATLKIWLDVHVHGVAGTPPVLPSPSAGTIGASKVKAE
jgi:hypothetical protein